MVSTKILKWGKICLLFGKCFSMSNVQKEGTHLMVPGKTEIAFFILGLLSLSCHDNQCNIYRKGDGRCGGLYKKFLFCLYSINIFFYI